MGYGNGKATAVSSKSEAIPARQPSGKSALFEPWRNQQIRAVVYSFEIGALRLYPSRRARAMSGHHLLVILLVGLIAGWLAGKIVRGTGFGLVADMALGIVGAFIGNWLLPHVGIHLGVGLVGVFVTALIGAILLLIIIGLLRGGAGERWGYRSGGWFSRFR
jgi:uncharacterized membrane protein YeaQ/YmgE (transglycosylase-associated protein family)